MPASCIERLFGTQYQNAAFFAVPPSSGAFSSRMTSSPNQRANSAAGSPPPPPPTTTTSAVASNTPPATGAADSRSLVTFASHGVTSSEVRACVDGGRNRGYSEEVLHHPSELRHRVLHHRRAA